MRWLLLLWLALPGVAFAQAMAPVMVYQDIDCGAPYVERAMDTPATACTGSGPQVFNPTAAEIATKARDGSISMATGVIPLPNILGGYWPSVAPASVPYAVLPKSCHPTYDYENTDDANDFIDEVQSTRATYLEPVHWSEWQRIDIVSYVTLADPSFNKDWLATTTTPYTTVQAFFSGDTGTNCTAAGGCSFIDTYGALSHVPIKYIAALSGSSDAYSKTVVGYLPHTSTNKTCVGNTINCQPWSTEHLARLDNAGYQAWQIARITAIWNRIKTKAYAIRLDWKPEQFFCREPGSSGAPLSPANCGPGYGTACSRTFRQAEHWLDGNRQKKCGGTGSSSTWTFEDVDSYITTNDTPFTAPPTGYGWSQYVQGFRAVVEGLVSAGVPVEVNVGTSPWWRCPNGQCPDAQGVNTADGLWPGGPDGIDSGIDTDQFFDDPATDRNENADVLAIARLQKRTYYYKPSNVYSVEAEAAMLADLRSYGVKVFRFGVTTPSQCEKF